MKKRKESNIFSEGFSTEEAEFKAIESKLKKTHKTTIVTTAEIDGVEDDDYFALSTKFRNLVKNGLYKDMEKVPEAVMRAKYLYKLAWSAGMTTAEVQDQVSKGLASTDLSECRQILEEARKLLYAETSDLNPSKIFRAYVERARRIIKMMEDMTAEIKQFWKVYGFTPDTFQKEYTVLLKMIFDAEKEILKLGIDLGTIKGNDKVEQTVFNVLNLVPDRNKALEQRQKMIEDADGNETSK